MQDYLDLLPSTPAEFDASNIDSIKKTTPAPAIEVDEIKEHISGKLFYELASNNDKLSESEIVLECIKRAETLAVSLLNLVGVLFTLYSKTQRLVVCYLTIYELYLYNGDIEGANKWLDRANILISNRYKKDLDDAKNERLAYVSVAKSEGKKCKL